MFHEGVVAIPSNTNSWPNYYHNQAEELIRQNCPNGYEIVQEEECVTGQVAYVFAVGHIDRFDRAYPDRTTTGQLQPTAQGLAAEREGHHHAGGLPRPQQPERRILTCAGARSTLRCFGLGNVPLRRQV
jgi:hypothetical protein